MPAPDNRKPLTPEEIRARVEARVAEEKGGKPASYPKAAAPSADNPRPMYQKTEPPHFSLEEPKHPAVDDHDFILQCLEQGDRGDGCLFGRLMQGRLAYVGQSDEWMHWTGAHWSIDKAEALWHATAATAEVAAAYEGSAKHWMGNLVQARSAGADDQAKKIEAKIKKLYQRVDRLNSVSGIDHCILMGRRNQWFPIAVNGEDIDQHPWLLAVNNGVVDLQTGELVEGRPEDLLVRHSSVEWRGIDAPCPEWERFMLEIMDGDPEMVGFLQRAFGYGLVGRKSEHVFLMLYGAGRNGKSLMTEVICSVLGNSADDSALAGPIQSEMLLDQGRTRTSAGPSPDIMRMRGLRIAIASETDDGARFSSSRVKWLSGGDTLTGRAPHDRRNTTFNPTHLLVLLTNHRPYAPGDDFAFWQRIRLVEFPMAYVDREPVAPNERPQDKGLRERLMKERSGILAWLVRGALDLQRRGGLDTPEKVTNATREYMMNEDDIGRFLEDCCIVQEGLKVNASELYKAFVWWCSVNLQGQKIMSQKRMGQTIMKRFEKYKSDGRYWYRGLDVSLEVQTAMAEEEDSNGKTGNSFR